jgi:hypothetical protein
LQDAHLEAWGPFGRGWALKRFSAQVIEPQGIPVIAYPKAWSPSIEVMPEVAAVPNKKKNMHATAPEPSHTLAAEVVYFDPKDEADMTARFKGQLKGKIVFMSPMREVKAHFETLGTRRDEKNLLGLANSPLPRPQGRGGAGGGPNRNADFLAQLQLQAKKLQFVNDEGAGVLSMPGAAMVEPCLCSRLRCRSRFSRRPLVRRPRRTRRVASTLTTRMRPKFAPQITMAVEHYNRIVRMIQAGEKVKMEINLEVQFQDQDLNGYNTVAEIPGSDPALKTRS